MDPKALTGVMKALRQSGCMTVTLADAEEGTQLTIVESGFDQLPAHRRDEAYRMNEPGWAEQTKNIERHVAASE